MVKNPASFMRPMTYMETLVASPASTSRQSTSAPLHEVNFLLVLCLLKDAANRGRTGDG